MNQFFLMRQRTRAAGGVRPVTTGLGKRIVSGMPTGRAILDACGEGKKLWSIVGFKGRERREAIKEECAYLRRKRNGNSRLRRRHRAHRQRVWGLVSGFASAAVPGTRRRSFLRRGGFGCEITSSSSSGTSTGAPASPALSPDSCVRFRAGWPVNAD